MSDSSGTSQLSVRAGRPAACSESAPVLVIGATGRVGRALVTELLGKGIAVRALTRQPAAAGLPPQIDVVAGDLTVPESLDAALHGIGAAFLLWTAPPDTAGAVIERLASYTRRVVFLSSPHNLPHPFFQQANPMARLHAEIERVIEASGLTSTVIRPGMFASNARHWWASMICEGDVVRWPYGAAETAPIDDRDIAAVAARCLLEERHAGGDYVLTGPESLSQAEQVQIVGTVIGRRLQFDDLSPEEFRRDAAGHWPPLVVEMLLAAWGATMGRPALVTSTVADVTGSAPRTFQEWVRDHATEFTNASDSKTADSFGQ